MIDKTRLLFLSERGIRASEAKEHRGAVLLRVKYTLPHACAGEKHTTDNVGATTARGTPTFLTSYEPNYATTTTTVVVSLLVGFVLSWAPP